MKTVAILNFKGGVGKTTFTACSAQALALAGFRVLVIDNDYQHNLSTMLQVPVSRPTIRDVYVSAIGNASRYLLEAAKPTTIPNLHVIGAPNELYNGLVKDPYQLSKCFTYSSLHRFYDYVLIDNGPGIDLLQEASLHAADEVFVPTELSRFAVDGIRELQQQLAARFPGDCSIGKIIPNFYRNTKAQRAHLDALRAAFPDKVVSIEIPYDSVFDELVTRCKILYIHHLFSKVAAYYLKLVHELFSLDEQKTWEMAMERRTATLVTAARDRLHEARKKNPRLKKADVGPASQSATDGESDAAQRDFSGSQRGTEAGGGGGEEEETKNGSRMDTDEGTDLHG